jgi:site-specific DNA-methyltransferase (adenine-specific)
MQEIIEGDCLEEMKKYPDNHFSCIVTDPPYGISFMGIDWDHEVPDKSFWEECYRIAKPGAFLVAMGGTRKFHRLTCAIEDSGFEIRDCISWLYGTGFPKSHNYLGLKGYGTALKPAWEPCIVAMKPCEGTFAQNAEKWGQAGLNIGESTIGSELLLSRIRGVAKIGTFKNSEGGSTSARKGRWPANVIMDEEAAALLDEQHPIASRFFYCAKASASERNFGLSALQSKATHRLNPGIGGGKDPKAPTFDKNYHPTIKPLKLMKYLIKLVMPPENGLLLDPFAGSGTTILAAKHLGFSGIGIEKDASYCEIARARLAA